MATTRKSASKKPAAKQAKKPAAAKTVKATKSTKTTTKKTTAKKQPAKTSAVKVSPKTASKSSANKPAKVTKKRGMFENLRITNYVMAGVHAALAILVVVLAKTVSMPLTTFHTTTDSLASLGGDQVYAHATRTMFDINIAYLICAFFAVGALVHLSAATWYRKKYEAQFNEGVSKLRGVGFALVAALVVVTASLVMGISDKTTLALIAGATGIMVLSGLVVELQASRGVRPERLSKLIGVLGGLAPIGVIGWYLVATKWYGEVMFKNYIYVLAGTVAILWLVCMIMQLKAARKSGRFADYLTVEYSYIVWLAVACVAVAAQIYAAILM